MHKKARVLAISLALVLPLALTAQADTSADAKAWLEKMAANQSKAFAADIEGDITVSQMGQTIDMKMKGSMTKASDERMNMSMTMNMQIPNMPEPMNMAMNMVSDGTTMWMEMENPMMGGKQVMKLPVDKMEQMAQMGGGGMGGMTQMDPVKQVEQLATVFDFQVAGTSGGQVTLRAELNAETLAQAGGQIPPGMAEGEMVLVLDEKTAFPVEMRMGPAAEPMMVMRFSNVRTLDEASLDASLFSYTPPEGVQVMDLGAMLGAMGEQGGEN